MATSISESLLAYWAKIGVLKADIIEGAGSGRHRRFSLVNLFEIELANRLSRCTSLEGKPTKKDGYDTSAIPDVLIELRNDRVWESLQGNEEQRRAARLLLVCFYSQAALDFLRQQNPKIASRWPQFYLLTTSAKSAAVKVASDDWMTDAITVIDLAKLVDRVKDAVSTLNK